jgi:hypothetical protein
LGTKSLKKNKKEEVLLQQHKILGSCSAFFKTIGAKKNKTLK